MSYSHTQRGGLHWLLLATAGLCFVGAYLARANGEDGPATVLLCVSILVVLLSLCFRHLVVRDGGEALEVTFGPIGLFRTRIPYASIESVRPARSSLIDGWGVHWVPGRGWTWNLWGKDCVELTRRGGTMRIGTDDREALTIFLAGRIAPRIPA